MVRHNISRWSPATCNCVIELMTVYDDNNEKILEEQEFLLMNNVCDKHKHLASTTHRENHHELSNVVLDHIEEAKRLNLQDWQAALDRCRTEIDKMDVLRQRSAIDAFNYRITEEWKFLISPPHAFDQHIHEQIKNEQ